MLKSYCHWVRRCDGLEYNFVLEVDISDAYESAMPLSSLVVVSRPHRRAQVLIPFQIDVERLDVRSERMIVEL